MASNSNSRKGVTKGRKTTATPLLRRAPRGKPFEKGNAHGLATRFVPGVCPNPGGRPKCKKLSEAYQRRLEANAGERIPIETEADSMAEKVFKMAKRGSLPAIREIGDRSEGRPNVSVSVGPGGDNLALIVAHMNERSRELGRPEGWIPPLLEEGEDAEPQ